MAVLFLIRGQSAFQKMPWERKAETLEYLYLGDLPPHPHTALALSPSILSGILAQVSPTQSAHLGVEAEWFPRHFRSGQRA